MTKRVTIRTKKLLIASIISILLLGTAGLALAAFGDKSKVLGSKFSVASADIKLLLDITQGASSNNLYDELQGPDFSNVTPNWTDDYLIKLYNTGSTDLQLVSNSNYSTANDPDELRSYIYVEPIFWDDVNENGIVETGEEGESLGKKSIVKWKTEGFNLGTLPQGSVRGLILRFSTNELSDTKQGKSGIFDFEFESISL